ncbi:MAG: hypothetical protein HFH53_06365 [Hespellia sp.]|jgi:hypothetical protein|nr:hypothetical protein [Hespellia sp.]
MKNFLKGAAVVAVVTIVLIIVNVICNINGIDLDSVSTGTTSAICAMFIYNGLTKDDKK